MKKIETMKMFSFIVKTWLHVGKADKKIIVLVWTLSNVQQGLCNASKKSRGLNEKELGCQSS